MKDTSRRLANVAHGFRRRVGVAVLMLVAASLGCSSETDGINSGAGGSSNSGGAAGAAGSGGSINSTGGTPGSGGSGISGSGGMMTTGTGGTSALSTLDEACDGTDWTGRKVLALTAPQYDTTLLIGAKLAGTITPLTITVSYETGAIRCIPHWNPPPGSEAPSLPAQVEVDVDISFVTEDLAFNETFTTALSAFPDASQAAFQHSIPEAELTGSFDPELDGYEDVTINLSGTFAADATSGNVGKSGREPGKTSSSFPFAGQWPAPR